MEGKNFGNSEDILVKIIRLDEKRRVNIKSFFFENGCFIIISENKNKIGGVTIASTLLKKTTSAKIIPSKYDSLFINSIAQRISLMLNGICLVSLYNESALTVENMKTIMGEILNMVSERTEKNAKK